jgi:hypothetical protein
MNFYPEVLISHRAYPELNEKDIVSWFFIRRTNENIYPFLEKFKPLEIIDKLLPSTTKRDVFVLSVSLYGYYDERHLSFKVHDVNLNQYWNREPDFPAERIACSIEPGFPLFLSAARLYEIPFEFEDELFLLSFWHKPTVVNYWHFQLFTRDSEGRHLPRKPKPGEKETGAETKRFRRLAILILEYVISKSICLKSEARKFRHDDIERMFPSDKSFPGSTTSP